MLRIEVHEAEEVLVMRLYGRLAGEYANQVQTLLARCKPETKLVVDLTEVTFVDSVGEEVLSLFGRLRGEFIVGNSYAKDLCERLHLPLASGRRRKLEITAPANVETPLS
jgi:hypothetical protein